MKIVFKDACTFVTALKAMATIAYKDEIRPHLNSVFFKRNASTLDMVATDGVCMAVYRFRPEAFVASGDGDSVLVPLASVTAALKGAGRKPDAASVDSDANTIAIGACQAPFRSVEVAYPPYTTVFPKTIGNQRLPGLDPQRLAVAAKAFDSFDYVGMKLLSIAPSAEALDAVSLTCAHVPNLMIIIMPVKGGTNPTPASAIADDPDRLPWDTRPVKAAPQAPAAAPPASVAKKVKKTKKAKRKVDAAAE